MSEEKNNNSRHDVMLYNKSKISISGITGVESFDETQISAITQDGELLMVEGGGIEICDFNVEKQILEAKGDFTAFFYDARNTKTKANVFGRLFGSK